MVKRGLESRGKYCVEDCKQLPIASSPYNTRSTHEIHLKHTKTLLPHTHILCMKHKIFLHFYFVLTHSETSTKQISKFMIIIKKSFMQPYSMSIYFILLTEVIKIFLATKDFKYHKIVYKPISRNLLRENLFSTQQIIVHTAPDKNNDRKKNKRKFQQIFNGEKHL